MIQVHVDAWGCPLLPPPQVPCFSYPQVSISELNILTLFLYHFCMLIINVAMLA